MGSAAKAEDRLVDDVAGLDGVRAVVEAVLGDPVVVVVAVGEELGSGRMEDGKRPD